MNSAVFPNHFIFFKFTLSSSNYISNNINKYVFKLCGLDMKVNFVWNNKCILVIKKEGF